MFEDKENYGQLKASIYFNSLNCRIDDTTASEALQDTFVDMLGSDVFV